MTREPRYITAVRLRREGLSYVEIAERLGASDTCVGSLLNHARRRGMQVCTVGPKWNAEAALAMRARGFTAADIARHYALDVADVRKRLTHAEVAAERGDRSKKQRRCLGVDCGRTFASSGPGNRLCQGCSRSYRRNDGDSPFEPAYG